MCCMLAPLQHEASHARGALANGAGDSGEGHGFEALKLTWLPCAAYSPSCNTGHRMHTWCQPLEPVPAG